MRDPEALRIIDTTSTVIPAGDWVESNPASGKLIIRETSVNRSLSLWSLEGVKVASVQGLLITPQGEVLQESATEYDAGESIKSLGAPLQVPATEILAGDYMSLYGRWSEGFYHWMLEWLPRAYFAEKSGFTGRYVVNNIRPFTIDALCMLGIDFSRIMLPPAEIWAPERLWVAESCHAGELADFPFIFRGMREKFLSLTKRKEGGARYYISRTNPNRPRRVVNEPELIALLHQYGFQAIDLENIPLKQQIDIVSEAEAIVSPHGAGLVHALFCAERALVVELFAPDYVNPCCLALMDIFNHRYHPLTSLNVDGKYKYGDGIHAPLNLVELTLRHELT